MTLVGYFIWDGEGFSNSAENVHFTIEGEGEVPVLRATLFNQDGEVRFSHTLKGFNTDQNKGIQRDINLAERISNDNGNFAYSTRI